MNQLDADYYLWLTFQIATPNGKTYFDLFERMHNLEFIWTVPHDENRIQDGLDLRSEFSSKTRIRLTFVTTLEVLVALSRRVAFIAGGEERYWAWQLLKNLKLNKAYDPWTAQKAKSVEEILETLIWRTYQRDGRGGFFPLRRSNAEDQTKVEIWYQMQAYVNEMQEL